MNDPLIVSPDEWEAAYHALAAERRRMPWMAVEKEYCFEGPNGPASLLDLFEERRQLIVNRAFAEPGITGWPEHACIGCSLIADHVTPVAHLDVRDTTVAFASRGEQRDINRVKARVGWEIWHDTLQREDELDEPGPAQEHTS